MSLLPSSAMAAGSASLFLLVFVANEWFFNSANFEVAEINWVYLPAGMRLLCTLLFGGAGAVGLFVASWMTGVLYFVPDDGSRALSGGIASAVASYVVYRTARWRYGLEQSLVNLSSRAF